MGDGAYRLWQHWQQMHYPRRGLPLDTAALATLRYCPLELDLGELSADASRYFGRLRRLIELVLAEAALDESGQPVFPLAPLAAEEAP